MYLALTAAPVALVAPIVAAYPLVTALVSAIALREETVTSRMLIGAAVTVAAIVYLVAAPAVFAAELTRAEAEKTALALVPGGSTISGHLEREKGRRVWSFDIRMPRTKNITEVHVDAQTGAVVSKTIETPAEQAKEAAAEKKKK
jgi:hypothetical protein